MASTKISQLQPLSVLQGDDLLVAVDVSDTSMAPTGTNKRIHGSQIVSLSPEQFGAIGDDSSHPLSEFFDTLAEAQEVYPTAVSLSDQIDTVAWESMLLESVAANPGGRPSKIIIREGLPVYWINRELVVPSTAYQLVIEGWAGVELKAAAAIRSIMVIRAQELRFSCVTFQANTLADYGLLFQGSSFSHFSACKFEQAKLDGVHLAAEDDDAAYAVNDTNTFSDCWFVNCGTVYYTSGLSSVHTDYNIVNHEQVSGTVSVTNGGNTVTGSGTSFATLGLRASDTFIAEALPSSSNALFGQISVVGGNTSITTGNRQTFTDSASGVGYIICKGAGYFEELHSDNNINVFIRCLVRHCCNGMVFNGPYGPTLIGMQIDYCVGYGVSLSMTDDTQNMFGGSFTGGYFEAIGAAAFLFGAVKQFVVNGPTVTTVRGYHQGGNTLNAIVWNGYPDVGQIGVGIAVSQLPAQALASGANFQAWHRVTYDSITISSLAGASIPANFSAVNISNGAPITIAATPQIAAPVDTTHSQIIELMNTGAQTITLQSSVGLPGAALLLGGSTTLALAQYQCATFRWILFNWYLISTTGTLA